MKRFAKNLNDVYIVCLTVHAILVSIGPNPYHRAILMWSFQLTERHTYQSDGDKKVDMFQAVACPEGRQHHRTITMATPFLRYTKIKKKIILYILS